MEDKDLQNIADFLSENFEISAEETNMHPELQNRFELMRNLLIDKIDWMITNDFEGFMNLLYRIDVDESRLKEKLAIASEDPAAATVADMIIERQLKKIQTRKQFGGEDNNWSFDV